MLAPIKPAAPTLADDKTVSELLVVATPTDTHSSSEPGFVCHCKMPPKALKVRLSLAIVTAGERFGGVAAATIATGKVVATVAAMFTLASVFGNANAVGVIAKVEDRARNVAVTAEDAA